MSERPRNVALFGATGSIGASTLDVINRHPDRFRAWVLSANQNVSSLIQLCEKHRPDFAVITQADLLDELHAGLRQAGLKTEALAGPQALETLARDPRCDVVVAAIVGSAGVRSTLAAAESGKRLLIANKESVVVAGRWLTDAARRSGATIIPVDSEHNAIFQCLPQDSAQRGLRRLVLTASGGPFRGRNALQLRDITPEQACAHPNWVMGQKISVDSATLMNKGLEVIEAHHLFGVAADQIEVVVHPESMIHSLVEYVDGSHLAQLGLADMRTAIAYALAWPERIDAGVGSLDLAALGRLHFEAVDHEAFPCLSLAYAALREGGDAPTILNTANEVAVSAFLQRRLPFLGIAELIARTIDRMGNSSAGSLEQRLDTERRARATAVHVLNSLGTD